MIDAAERERMARLFHETYERLAPEYGYVTRKESAVPWEQVPENNRKLMIATCGVVGALCANEALEKACVVTCEFCAHPDWFIEPKTSWRWRASEAKKERGGWFHVVEDQYGSFTPVACQAAAIRALKAEG